jgi:hypothetical protein
MLSKEIASSLRGRSVATKLFPFSFREFLRHHGIEQPHDRLPGKQLRSFGKDVTLTDAWALYQVRWGELRQSGWGAPSKFDPTKVIQLGWAGRPGVPIDFWLDQVAFFIGSAPTDSINRKR